MKVVLDNFDFSNGFEELLPLIKAEYPTGEMGDSEYLDWEYFQNPLGTPEMVVARSESDEVVGQYVVIPQNYIVDGETVSGSLSLNTLTHKDFRGQGLFTRMALETYASCKVRGLDLTLGFPNMQSYPGFVRKLGFSHIGNAMLLVRPLRLGALVKGALYRKRYPKYGSYLERESLNRPGQHDVDEITISEFDVKQEAGLYRPFWETRRKLYNQTDRSPQFLEWRYKNIPTRSYTLLKATKGGKLLAFAVLRVRVVYGMKAGFVIDFNCLPEEESMRAGKTLLEFSKSLMRSKGAVFMGALITPDCAEFDVLRKSGFFKAPGRFLPHDAPVIIRWNGAGDSAASLRTIRKWFLTFGDYDAF